MTVFEFKNSGYELLKQSIDDVLVIIRRVIRRTPFVGMKQPTPHGGMLGSEVCLSVKYQGVYASKYRFNLILNEESIQSGTLNDRGEYSGLNINLFSGEFLTYKLEILEPINEESPGCNTEPEVIYESNRLVN